MSDGKEGVRVNYFFPKVREGVCNGCAAAAAAAAAAAGAAAGAAGLCPAPPLH